MALATLCGLPFGTGSAPAFAATGSARASGISPKAVPATLQSADAYEFVSRVNRASYRLTVVLPKDYAATDRRYPVLYLLDGDAMALLADYVLPRMFTMGDMPRIIVVGVGYPDDTGNKERALDYAAFPRSPTYKGWKVPADRGADNFLRVMKEEVVPLIDSRYRTDPTSRGFGGHSLGGYLTTYAMFHASDTFNHFWISSPSLFRDDASIFQDEAAYAANHKDLEARVFADIGADEIPLMRELLAKMSKTVESRGYKSLRWKLEMPEHQIHTTVPSVAIADAFKFLYGDRPAVQVERARLEAISGKYRLSDGQVLKLSTDGHDLYALGTLPVGGVPDYTVKMTAQSPNFFYTRTLGIYLRFDDSSGGAPSHVKVFRESGVYDDASGEDAARVQ